MIMGTLGSSIVDEPSRATFRHDSHASTVACAWLREWSAIEDASIAADEGNRRLRWNISSKGDTVSILLLYETTQQLNITQLTNTKHAFNG